MREIGHCRGVMIARNDLPFKSVYETLVHPNLALESLETLKFYRSVFPVQIMNVVIAAAMTFQFLLDAVDFTIPFVFPSHPILKVAGASLLVRKVLERT